MALKITFELSQDAATQAALNAGCETDRDAELCAMGIIRRSKIKKIVTDSNQYEELMAQQNAGYNIVAIEPQ